MRFLVRLFNQHGYVAFREDVRVVGFRVVSGDKTGRLIISARDREDHVGRVVEKGSSFEFFAGPIPSEAELVVETVFP